MLCAADPPLILALAFFEERPGRGEGGGLAREIELDDKDAAAWRKISDSGASPGSSLSRQVAIEKTLLMRAARASSSARRRSRYQR